jgi:DNA-binding response OmpR family regulator
MATPRVLVIDAARATIEELREAIEKAGYDWEIALTSETAMTILEQRRMDAVILDLELAELRGAKVVREIRRAAGAVPLIGLVSADVPFDEKEAVREELTHWIERAPDTHLAAELERVLPTLSYGR